MVILTTVELKLGVPSATTAGVLMSWSKFITTPQTVLEVATSEEANGADCGKSAPSAVSSGGFTRGSPTAIPTMGTMNATRINMPGAKVSASFKRLIYLQYTPLDSARTSVYFFSV